MKLRQYLPIIAAAGSFLAGSMEEANASGRTRQYTTPPMMQNQIVEYIGRRNINPRVGIAAIGLGVLAIIATGVWKSYKKEHKTGYLPEDED